MANRADLQGRQPWGRTQDAKGRAQRAGLQGRGRTTTGSGQGRQSRFAGQAAMGQGTTAGLQGAGDTGQMNTRAGRQRQGSNGRAQWHHAQGRADKADLQSRQPEGRASRVEQSRAGLQGQVSPGQMSTHRAG